MRKIEKIMISNNTMEKKNFFAPLALGLGATRRAAMLLLVMMLTTATAWAWSGSGTSADPYQVASASDLAILATDVNGGTDYSQKFFLQTADITLSSAWTPIGSSSHPFKGHYNGGGCKISGLSVSGSYQYAGLFGYTRGVGNSPTNQLCELKNIVVEGCNIDVSGTSGTYAGGIVGYASDDSRIINCRVSGTVTATTGAGGIAGQLWTTPSGHISMMSQCFADVTVAANNKGKLIGYVSTAVSETALNSKTSYYHADGSCTAFGNNVDITYSVPLYTVTASSSVTVAETNATLTHGGKHFFASGATATLTIDDASKAFSTFSVSGATYSLAADRKNATVTLASSDATVSATLITITGSCGTNATWTMSDADGNGTFETLTINGTGAITSSPWATDFAATIERVNIGSADLTISGNPFSTLGEGALIVVPTTAYAVSYSSAAYASKLRVALGSYLFTATNEGGTAAYEIANETDLRNLSAAVNQNHQGCNGLTFCQTAPITLNGTFTPIGYFNDSSDKQDFYGTYDGGGYTISGLSVSSTQVYTGLFGVVRNGGMVKNVRLISPSVTCNFYESRVGALIGLADQCTIENCSVVSPIVSATASSQYNKVGALVGNLSAANVQNCFVVSPTVSAAGSTKVGAICGYAYSASTNSYCTLTNVYYYNSSLEAIGQHDNSQISKVTNVARARKVTAGDGVTIAAPAATEGFTYGSDNYYREGLTLTLSATAPTGYTAVFSANGTAIDGTTYTVNSTDGDVTITLSGNVPITYSVHFNGNGNTGGSMSNQDFTYDAAQNLTANGFTRTGYTFAGWATSPNGPVEYADNASVINLTATNGGTVNLYAKWGIPYIDADGNTQLCTNNVTVLTNETDVSDLAGGWYVVMEDVSYNSQFYCNSGDIHLILCDGAKMTVTETDNDAISIEKGKSLTIYAQSTGSSMGQLVATSSNSDGIYVSDVNLTICGGQVCSNAIFVHGDVTIYDGRITVRDARESGCGIRSKNNLTIHGGQVSATGDFSGIFAHNTITLGLRNATDYIYASSFKTNYDEYEEGIISVKAGQTLTDGTNTYSGTLTDDQVSALAGKTLRPCLALADNADNTAAIRDHKGQALAVALQGRTLYKDGDWNTLCLPFDVSTTSGPLAGDNVVAMTLNTSESNLTGSTLTLNFDAAPTTIPAGTPFIIKWGEQEGKTGYLGTIIENPVFTGVTIDNTDRSVTSSDGYVTFKGTYSPIVWDTENKSILFVGTNNTLYWPTAGGHVNACRAYFDLGTYEAREFVLNFDDQTTGVIEVKEVNEVKDDSWYTLNGVKLSGKPTKSGLYIHGNRKVVIK